MAELVDARDSKSRSLGSICSTQIWGTILIKQCIFVNKLYKFLFNVLKKGTIGETYNIGGNNQTSNIEITQKICSILDKLSPNKKGNHSQLIEFVQDRPGHDFRYNLDTSKIKKELNWQPSETFDSGLEKTVSWYFEKYISGEK